MAHTAEPHTAEPHTAEPHDAEPHDAEPHDAEPHDAEQLGHHHDHSACIGGAMERARALCASRGARLTDIREQVLGLVWSSHRPRGAYAILEDMARDGKRVAPLTVYRALDFLVEQGLVHRIESLNAFVGCPEPGQVHSGQFLVCEACGNAQEMTDPGVARAVAEGAQARGFRPKRQTVEVLGLCPDCQ